MKHICNIRASECLKVLYQQKEKFKLIYEEKKNKDGVSMDLGESNQSQGM